MALHKFFYFILRVLANKCLCNLAILNNIDPLKSVELVIFDQEFLFESADLDTTSYLELVDIVESTF